MPHYYFDMSINGDERCDAEGVYLSDPISARREAIVALLAMAAEIVPIQTLTGATMHVRDEQNLTIAKVDMQMTLR